MDLERKNTQNQDAISKESTDYDDSGLVPLTLPTWLKVGALATASAVAGGIAGVWIYRESVKKLHKSGETAENTKFSNNVQPWHED